MKAVLLPILTLAFLVGCSDNQSPEPAAPSDQPLPVDATDQASPEPAEPDPNQALYDMIPGLDFQSGLHVVESRVYSPQGEDEQRQGFTLEYSDGDASSTMEKIREAFVAAGYKPVNDAVMDGAVLKQGFSKKGGPVPFVAVYPDTGGKPVRPDSIGKVWISWKLDGSSDTQQAQ